MSNTTIIELGGRRYRVTCLPDLEPMNQQNVVEAYLSITEFLKKKLLGNTDNETRSYSATDIQAWLDKFPKPLIISK